MSKSDNGHVIQAGHRFTKKLPNTRQIDDGEESFNLGLRIGLGYSLNGAVMAGLSVWPNSSCSLTADAYGFSIIACYSHIPVVSFMAGLIIIILTIWTFNRSLKPMTELP